MKNPYIFTPEYRKELLSKLSNEIVEDAEIRKLFDISWTAIQKYAKENYGCKLKNKPIFLFLKGPSSDYFKKGGPLENDTLDMLATGLYNSTADAVFIFDYQKLNQDIFLLSWVILHEIAHKLSFFDASVVGEKFEKTKIGFTEIETVSLLRDGKEIFRTTVLNNAFNEAVTDLFASLFLRNHFSEHSIFDLAKKEFISCYEKDDECDSISHSCVPNPLIVRNINKEKHVELTVGPSSGYEKYVDLLIVSIEKISGEKNLESEVVQKKIFQDYFSGNTSDITLSVIDLFSEMLKEMDTIKPAQ